MRALLEDAARGGNNRAQAARGWLHQQGLGGARDPVGAFQWYRRAARSGSAEAQYPMGLMHDLGIGMDGPLGREAWYARAKREVQLPG